MRSVFDLPAHPMLVHAPLVLLPLTTLVACLFNLRSDFRRRLALPVLGAVVIVFVTTFLAMESGEAFDDALAGQVDVSKHADLAEATRWWLLLMLVLSAALVVAVRRVGSVVGAKSGVSSRATTAERALGLAIAVVGILATIWMIRTGHEGARVVWDGTFKKR